MSDNPAFDPVEYETYAVMLCCADTVKAVWPSTRFRQRDSLTAANCLRLLILHATKLLGMMEKETTNED